MAEPAEAAGTRPPPAAALVHVKDFVGAAEKTRQFKELRKQVEASSGPGDQEQPKATKASS